METNYIKSLKEKIEIMNDIIELDKKIIKEKDEYISQLQTKIDELIELTNQAIEVAKHHVITTY